MSLTKSTADKTSKMRKMLFVQEWKEKLMISLCAAGLLCGKTLMVLIKTALFVTYKGSHSWKILLSSCREWTFHSLVRVVSIVLFWDWKSIRISFSGWNWNELYSKSSWKYPSFTLIRVVRHTFLQKIWCTKRVGFFLHSFIGFLGQIRQMSSQFHFQALELKLFCLTGFYCVSNSEFAHSISFWGIQVPSTLILFHDTQSSFNLAKLVRLEILLI